MLTRRSTHGGGDDRLSLYCRESRAWLSVYGAQIATLFDSMEVSDTLGAWRDSTTRLPERQRTPIYWCPSTTLTIATLTYIFIKIQARSLSTAHTSTDDPTGVSTTKGSPYLLRSTTSFDHLPARSWRYNPISWQLIPRPAPRHLQP